MGKAEKLLSLIEAKDIVIIIDVSNKSKILSKQDFLEELIERLAKGRVKGKPDFTKFTITVKEKDFEKAKKILNNPPRIGFAIKVK